MASAGGGGGGGADGDRLTLRVARAAAPALTAQLLATLPVVDLSVEDPPIEAVIDQVYQGGILDGGRPMGEQSGGGQ